MTDKQLLQYYMALSGDLEPFCKHAEWDHYSYECPYKEYEDYWKTFYCGNCPYCDLDIEKSKKEAEEDIQKMLTKYKRK